MSFDSSADRYLNSSDHMTGNDLDWFSSYFCGKTFKKALDVACAAGHFANAFSSEAVFTTDLSFPMLKKAGEAFGFDKSAVSKGEFLPFKNETFQLVGCRIAMHHFRNPCMFIAEVYRILEKDGYFVLIDSITDKKDRHLNRIELLRDESHFFSHTTEDITAIAQAEGFYLEDLTVFSKRHDFAEWVTRINPSDEKTAQVEKEFLRLPKTYKERYRLEIENGRLKAYSDKKAMFIFRK